MGLEFDLVYFKIAVEHFRDYTTGTIFFLSFFLSFFDRNLSLF